MAKGTGGSVLLTPFVRVMPRHALHHKWRAGQSHSGRVGGNYVFWLLINGQVTVRAAQGFWELEEGAAFLSKLSGTRTVQTQTGAEWFSIGLQATVYDSLDLLALLPLPAGWTPPPNDFAALKNNCAEIVRAWGAPDYTPVDAHSFSAYLRQQWQHPLQNDVSRTLLCEGYARVLFAQCWNRWSHQRLEAVVGSRFPVWMPGVLARLRETPGMSVEELARAVGMSRRQLGRVFQESFGMPPRVFLNRKRCEAARQLLQTSSLSLGEIARQTGFSDVSYFSRAFKAEWGTPPETYRRHVRQGDGDTVI